MKNSPRRDVLRGIGGIVGAGIVGTNSAVARNDEEHANRDVPLTVMSFNIHGGIGTDSVYDLQRIADVIEAVDPDVVALQEVHDQYRAHWQEDSPTDYDAQHELLAEWLGMNHVAAGAVRDYRRSENDASWTEEELEAGYRRRILNVVLSKKPIIDSTVYTYEAQSRWDPPHQDVQARILLETRLNVNGSHVWVYNTHLTAGTGSLNIELRTSQVQELLEIAGEAEGPKILAGDFNFPDGEYGWNEAWFDPPHQDPAYMNYKAMTDAYTDLLREHDADAPTAGMEPIGWGPVRLDYLFASDEVTSVSAETIMYGSDPYPSDHRPIVADVTVPRGNRGHQERNL